MIQADLQKELNNIKWTGKVYELQEEVILDGTTPLLIEGCYLKGYAPFAVQYGEPRHTTIRVTNYTTPAIQIHGPFAGLMNHVFYYPLQSRYEPNYYPVTVDVPKRTGDKPLNPNVYLKSLSFIGAMSFISLTGGGQHVVEDIRGQILGTGIGIYIDNAADVIRIKDIHFWPNFSASSIKYGYYNPPIHGNARGIVMRRVDWPQLSNIFMYGLHVGLQMGGPGGDPQISNIAFDACSVGLDLYSLGYQGMQIDNFRVAGNQTHGAWRCIPIIGRASVTETLQIANYHADGALQKVVWQTSPQYLQIANKVNFA